MIGRDVKEWREGVMVTALNTDVARLLGRGQIFFGAAAAVFQVVLIAINSDQGVPFLAAGIWSGFFFLLAGFAALAAAARPTRCYVITLMVLSIISAIAAVFGLFVCSVLDIHVTRRNCEFFDYFSEVYYDENEAAPTTPVVASHLDLGSAAEVAIDDAGVLWGVVSGGNRRVYGLDGEIEIPSRKDSHWFACSRPSYVMALILDSFLLVFSVVSTIASIWCSVLCCRAVCFPDPHPRFLYFSPTSTGDVADASINSGCAASVPVAVMTHPAAAVVCLPIANGAVATNGIVSSSSQYLTNGSIYPSSTEYFEATSGENLVRSTIAPIVTTASMPQPNSDVDSSGPPSYNLSQLPPYQAAESGLPQDVSLPPYNPNFVET